MKQENERKDADAMRAVYLSIQTTDASAYMDAAESANEKAGARISFYGCNRSDAEDDPLTFHELSQRTREADFVFVRCMADPTRFRRFDEYEKTLRECPGIVFVFSGSPDVQIAYRDLFKGSDEDFVRLCSYAALKGRENDESLLLYAYRMATGADVEVPDPVSNRSDGIYRKGFPQDVSKEDYLSTLKGRPVAGVLFPYNLWLYGNLSHIDALCDRLEAHGMDVIPVFYAPSAASSSKVRPVREVAEEYFTRDGRTIIDVLLVCSPFSQLTASEGTADVPPDRNYFHTLLGVPAIQAMSYSGEFKDYQETAGGPPKSDLKSMVCWPELDGQIIGVPYAHSRSESKKSEPLPDRVDHLCRSAAGWARLGRKPPSERKVAIMMYQVSPGSERIGNAGSLDAPASVVSLMKSLRDSGYALDWIPEDAAELMRRILDGVTYDFGGMTDSEIVEKAAGTVGKAEHEAWLENIPEFNRKEIKERWGDAPGDIASAKGRMVIPGFVTGNVVVTLQPPRGWGEGADELCHDPVLPPHNQYLAFYRWLKDVFGADAVIHMGTHGTLEWLPGRSAALSGKCYPDLVLDSIPDIYPYMIDDPGEGIQAKRRSEAVLVGHLNAVMTRAELHDGMLKIDSLIQEYIGMGAATGPRREALLEEILEAAREENLLNDVGLDEGSGIEDLKERIWALHDLVTEAKDALIRDGLHILGRVPDGDLMAESVYSLSRLDNGSVPSLRRSVGESMEADPEKDLDAVDWKTMELIRAMMASEFRAEECLEACRSMIPGTTPALEKSVGYVCERLYPSLKATSGEIGSVMEALSGGYVLPGPSGAPTRGNADILPTGRNYYGLDPDTLPTRSAWNVGKGMADQMISRYIEEKGGFPREIGFIIWATDTYKNGGDDIAYILWLMGVRPVWAESGAEVVGLEVIPLEELGRPRVDVTVRITGLFRDVFPNITELIDEAASMVMGLDESEEDNAMAANLRKDTAERMMEGIPEDEARKRSSVRVFGCPPGAYGPGVNHLIESGKWTDVKDLADSYVAWGSYAYGRGCSGIQMKDEFVRRISRVKATVKNMPDREIDLIDIDDVYGYLGGMNALVKAYGGDAVSYMGDGSDPGSTKVRTLGEEMRFVFRSKALNPKYIEGMKRHGYRGAAEMVNVIEHAFGMDATSDVMDKWMYDGIAEKYLLDKDTWDWMEEVNPYAAAEILDRLQEAVSRRMWEPDEDMLEKLDELSRLAEDRLEDLSDRSGEIGYIIPAIRGP
ncbi:MAG: cobaltochelatase subunit CobN [Candidatus Methanomethylophilaceae archaeon]|nr:cobaltochelatase subunit CobN [Candidatus Methanomethylophilaceae archaeon]